MQRGRKAQNVLGVLKAQCPLCAQGIQGTFPNVTAVSSRRRLPDPEPHRGHQPAAVDPAVQRASAVFGTSWHDGTWNQPKPAVVVEPVVAPAPASVNPAAELANAEANLRAAVRVYDYARKEIGEANRTKTQETVCNGRVVIAALPFTPERIRQHKSEAFKLFNKRRGELSHARRRLDAARTALGLPLLAAVDERRVVAAVIRASKQRPVVHHPIASVAAYAG